MKSKGPRKRYNLDIRPPENAAVLAAIAALEGVTVPDLINTAISKLIVQRQKKHGAVIEAILKSRGAK